MIVGVGLDVGTEALAREVSEVRWRGRTPFLLHGCEGALPGFRFEPSSECGRTPAGNRAVGLVFTRDADAERWARESRLDLAMPSRTLTAFAGDKLTLPELADEAGVVCASCLTVARADSAEALRLWRARGGRPLVVQLPEDGLTGAGTRLVGSADALAEVLDEWAGRSLKVAELVEGTPVTVSACVTANRVVASGLSHQLVGLAELGAGWGTHCGNQLLTTGDMTDATAHAGLDMAVRLGDVLRRRGYRGLFGVDAILMPDERFVVVEVNPRIQSVSSLVNVAELRAGLLPAPGLHVLAHLDQAALPMRGPVWPEGHLSQVVVYAHAGGVLRSGLRAGTWRLNGTSLWRVHDPRLDLAEPDSCVIWPFVGAGTHVAEGDRLAILQFARRVAPIGGGRQVLPWVLPWIDAVAATVTPDAPDRDEW